MDAFASPLLILSHMELFSIELPRLTSGILLKVVTNPILLVDWSVLFLYTPAYQALVFERNYLWATLSLS